MTQYRTLPIAIIPFVHMSRVSILIHERVEDMNIYLHRQV